jgi:DNA-binding NarL/FixJ family response regulator
VSQQANTDGLARPWQSELIGQRRLVSRWAGLDRTMVRTHTVVIADRAPAIRHGVRSVLESTPDICVVAEADTLDEVLAVTARCRPDVLVIEPELDGPRGVPVISRVLRVSPETGVLVFSTVDDDAAITSAIQSGARGYLVKSSGPDQILRGIHAVAAGEVIVGKAIASRFSALMSLRPEHYPFPKLTSRERDVLERIAAGKSNMAIARELALAPKTISNRVSSIFGKLGVADRAQAIVLARDAGLGRA